MTVEVARGGALRHGDGTDLVHTGTAAEQARPPGTRVRSGDCQDRSGAQSDRVAELVGRVERTIELANGDLVVGRCCACAQPAHGLVGYAAARLVERCKALSSARQACSAGRSPE